MSKKDKKPEETVEQVPTEPQQQPEEVPEEAASQETQAGQSQTETADPLLTELESLKNQVAQQEDKFLRLAAEYDNYRRRTAKEKESIWSEAKADAAVAFLPVYDNLERALKQETADEAYKKGVEENPLTPPCTMRSCMWRTRILARTPWRRSFRLASCWARRSSGSPW